MKLKFGDDESIEARDHYGMEPVYKKVRRWSLHRDESGQVVSMSWGGDETVIVRWRKTKHINHLQGVVQG